MDLRFLRFYELFGLPVVLWLYGFCSLITTQGHYAESVRKLAFTKHI